MARISFHPSIFTLPLSTLIKTFMEQKQDRYLYYNNCELMMFKLMPDIEFYILRLMIQRETKHPPAVSV